MDCLIEMSSVTTIMQYNEVNIFENNIELMREEVLDRLLDIASIIKKNKISLIVDYELHIKELNTKEFCIEKALELLQTMQDSKEVEIYYNLHNLVKKYYVDVMQLYINDGSPSPSPLPI
jgi:hypothetical protein